MPRTARLEELGLPLHLIFQGIERRSIFGDDLDRGALILRASRVFRELGFIVLAWALMDNHGHVVVRGTKGRVGTAMQRVLGPYAQTFNRRYERVGRLFRDRFWSRPVESDDDLAGLIGYVVLNPLRGGIVGSLDELCSYPWSSLSELMSPPRRREPLVSRVDTLALFGPTSAGAIEGLLSMLAGQYSDDPDGRDFARARAGMLGSRERTDLRMASVTELRLHARRIDEVLRAREGATAQRLRLERRGWTLDRVVKRVTDLLRVDEDRLRHGARRRAESRARGLISHFASTYLGCCDADIARATGVARQSATRARARVLIDADVLMPWTEFFEVSEDGACGAQPKR